ncbi:hypothetical protein [Microbulbifer sp. JSM ZJ756]|uniref:hypothetical protein n=1 Tax=Microbulbifer sp. JSM ZJ756 TaxID=3376191 RepID=UPI0037B69DD2
MIAGIRACAAMASAMPEDTTRGRRAGTFMTTDIVGGTDMTATRIDMIAGRRGRINARRAGIVVRRAGIAVRSARINTRRAGIVVRRAGIVVRRAGIVGRRAGIVVRRAGIIVRRAGIIMRRAGIIVRRAGIVVRSASIVADAVNMGLLPQPSQSGGRLRRITGAGIAVMNAGSHVGIQVGTSGQLNSRTSPPAFAAHELFLR